MFLSDNYFETYISLPQYHRNTGKAMVSSWHLIDVIELAATVSTILVLLSGIGICLNIKRKSDTSDTSAFPFLAGVINCTLWLKYGIFQRDQTLIVVNAIGLFLQLMYTVFYYYYSSNKSLIKKQLLMILLILFPILIYLKYFVDDLIIATQTSGLLACCGSVMFCASPLASLTQVCKTKSTESLPFALIFMTLIMALLWYVYGVLRSDYFIQIPNLLGASLSAFQLFLFFIFPRQTLTKADTH